MREIQSDSLEQQLLNNEQVLVYLYTPLCGTCQLTKKMLTVIEDLDPSVNIAMMNMNYSSTFAEKWKIESVPCLLLIENELKFEKIYAFRSIEFIRDKINTFLQTPSS
ncbi:thioredoxin [Bacillus sp. HMF5848]|uniref:thioredoxin family protein n=1 Tax=Bacillus sp. HMF5848 TaxID=2495421 RepID=UPI000F78B384|nr:thioredoxin family protein [Bacillus sp. HMF5848]RSK28466.1 thioredoxin [Bacillus sp. HMF5848]